MKKKWAFTAAAGVLCGLFLAGVLEVGSSTGWFGLEELASPGVPSWEHSYETTWDPSQDGVEGLSVRWAAGPVSVMPGEGPLITVTEYASRPLEEGERLALSSSGGVLEVGWNGDLLPLGALQDLEKRVEVKVPPELLSQLEKLSCWNISGEVSVSGAFAQELSLSSLSGDLLLSGVSGGQIHASTVSGDIQWAQGQAEELSVKSTSGAVQLVGMNAQECRLKTVTGPLAYQGAGSKFFGESVTGSLRAQLTACPQRENWVLCRGIFSSPCRRTMASRQGIPVFPATLPRIFPVRGRAEASSIREAALCFPSPPPQGMCASPGADYPSERRRCMYGAILGDIAGSRFEFSKPQGFDWRTVDLFGARSAYTDDTVLTVATKYAILTGTPYAKAYALFGKRYSRVGYGTMFKNWLNSGSQKGYNSYGNGSAMRVSYIGWHFDTLEAVEGQAARSSTCTHDHPEGIRAAQATAGAVFLARTGASKRDLARYFRKRFLYPVSKPLAFYRPFGKFDDTAMGTMPLAIRCFLESEDWESCIRNVFSIKCDTDTVACIAGGIADAFYGGTGQDEEALLKRFLVKPDENGRFDKFLYQWAVKTKEQAQREQEEKQRQEREEKEKGGLL